MSKFSEKEISQRRKIIMNKNEKWFNILFLMEYSNLITIWQTCAKATTIL
jgi:hypothetical protein